MEAATFDLSLPLHPDLFDDIDDFDRTLADFLDELPVQGAAAQVHAIPAQVAEAAEQVQDDVDIAAIARQAADVATAMLSQARDNAPLQPSAPAASTSAYTSSLASIIASLETAEGDLKVLHGLLVDWNEGRLSQKNKSFATPFEIVDWVCAHPDLAPPELYWHINQIYYDNGKCDDKHFYMASTLKKMLNMVSLEYGIPLDDMFKKFGGKEFYICAGETGGVLGKRKCSKKANGGFFCGNHACQRCDPVSDYKRWKGEGKKE